MKSGADDKIGFNEDMCVKGFSGDGSSVNFMWRAAVLSLLYIRERLMGFLCFIYN